MVDDKNLMEKFIGVYKDEKNDVTNESNLFYLTFGECLLF
jgi:hypothetical protein